MKLLNELLTPAAGQDASTSFNSSPGLLAHVFSYSIQGVITGTAAGTMKLQGSNDPVPDANFRQTPVWTPTNWTDVANSVEPITGAGTIMYDFNQCPGYNWVRVVYTSSSGTGTIILKLNTKGM